MAVGSRRAHPDLAVKFDGNSIAGSGRLGAGRIAIMGPSPMPVHPFLRMRPMSVPSPRHAARPEAAASASAAASLPIAHPPGRLIAVNGTRLWVETEGSGEPLLLLAGGPANSHLTFHPYFSALADRCQVIYLDYRGRGRSEQPERWTDITFDQDVADIEGVREALGLERLSIYGFSYGGMLAQAYALRHPARVGKLILANTVHSPEMWQRNHENINR
jgi:proline iminopeptidase